MWIFGKLGVYSGRKTKSCVAFKPVEEISIEEMEISRDYVIVVQQTEKTMAPHSSTLAWKIPWMEEPGGLQSMGPLRVGHD